MKILLILIFLFFLIYSANLDAQTANIDWVKHFASGIEPAATVAMLQAGDNLGNVYVTGHDGNPFSGVSIVTIKYNSDGERVCFSPSFA